MTALRIVLIIVTAAITAAFPLFVRGIDPSSTDAAASLFPGRGRPFAVSANNNDHRTGADNGNDNEEETELEGTVLSVSCPEERGSDERVAAACENLPEGDFIPAINPGSSPPDMYVHNLDGAVRVVFSDPASLDQFHEGDYVRVKGRTIHTFLFDAREASIVEDNDNS